MNETDMEKELENCCPLCGGKITEALEDFEALKVVSLYTGSHELSKDFKFKYKMLKLKLKMIEMGLIPK